MVENHVGVTPELHPVAQTGCMKTICLRINLITLLADSDDAVYHFVADRDPAV